MEPNKPNFEIYQRARRFILETLPLKTIEEIRLNPAGISAALLAHEAVDVAEGIKTQEQAALHLLRIFTE